MALPAALEEWMNNPSQERELVLKNLELTGDPSVGADKIKCQIIDKATGEELIALSVVGWVGVYTTYESLKEALLNEAKKRIRALIEQERARRAKAAAFTALQSSLPAEEEVTMVLQPEPESEQIEEVEDNG